MARSILGAPPQGPVLGASALTGSAGARTTAAGTEARLRQQRSRRYVDTMTRLDGGGHVHSHADAQALQQAIRDELPEVSVEALPMGIVAKCHLGAPHEVHTLDCSGLIMKHYKVGEPLAPMLERARSLAQHPSYAFIEVYPTKLITVSLLGQTAIIED